MIRHPAPNVRRRRWGESLRAAWATVRLEAALFRRLFTYTRPYRGRLVLSWFATAGYAAAGALLVSQVKPIFDEALSQVDPESERNKP